MTGPILTAAGGFSNGAVVYSPSEIPSDMVWLVSFVGRCRTTGELLEIDFDGLAVVRGEFPVDEVLGGGLFLGGQVTPVALLIELFGIGFSGGRRPFHTAVVCS